MFITEAFCDFFKLLKNARFCSLWKCLATVNCTFLHFKVWKWGLYRRAFLSVSALGLFINNILKFALYTAFNVCNVYTFESFGVSSNLLRKPAQDNWMMNQAAECLFLWWISQLLQLWWKRCKHQTACVKHFLHTRVK